VRNIRILTVAAALASVFAFSAVATAAAAELEQVPGKGTFTIESSKSVFETHSKEKVTCSKDKGSGKLTGPKTDESETTFEKCTGPLGVTCTGEGDSSGDIVTPIHSELVWLSKSKKEAGEKLELAKEITIKCSFVSLKVKGATLCPVKPTNEKTKKVEIVCTQSAGKQSNTEYENEAGEKKTAKTETNKGSGFEESGLQSTETLSLAEEGEIKAT
jgi:hypothetical protein